MYGSDKLKIYIQQGTNTQEMTRCNYNLTETGTGLFSESCKQPDREQNTIGRRDKAVG